MLMEVGAGAGWVVGRVVGVTVEVELGGVVVAPVKVDWETGEGMVAGRE